MLVSPDTFRASACSGAAKRLPGRRELAGRWSISLLAGGSTVWQHFIGRSQASLVARPPSYARSHKDERAACARQGKKYRECRAAGTFPDRLRQLAVRQRSLELGSTSGYSP